MRTNRINSLILGFAIIEAIIICLLLKQCHCPPCYEAGETVVRHDTVWLDKPLEPIVVKVPEAFKSVAKKSLKPKATISKTETVDTPWKVDGDGHAYASIADISSPCDTINYYSDTTINPMPDSCIIVVNDTLENNRITGRSIWLAFRIPQITTTITEVKKEKLKFYLGGSFTLNAKYFNRWGVGVTGALAIPKIGMADYTYDIRNNAHTIGVLALIRFKK